MQLELPAINKLNVIRDKLIELYSISYRNNIKFRNYKLWEADASNGSTVITIDDIKVDVLKLNKDELLGEIAINKYWNSNLFIEFEQDTTLKFQYINYQWSWICD